MDLALEMSRNMTADVWAVIGAVSAGVFLGTLLLAPVVVVRLPAGYFLDETERVWMAGRHPAVRWTVRAAKNTAGALCVLAGTAMLVLPGQGLLTIVIGLSLMDIPGKRRLERRLLTRPMVWQAMNAMRRACGAPALLAPAEQRDAP